MGVLENAVDMHVHGGPDIVPRKLLDTDIVRDAIKEKMSAVVLKTHLGSTVERAILVDNMTNYKIKVFGGISLNSFIGGFNSLAVKAALTMGAKVVWMPTFTSKIHLDFEKKSHKKVNALSEFCQNIDGLSVVDKNGEVFPEIIVILDMIAAADSILGCGHIGIAESKILIPLAKKHGVRKIIYNHPNNPINPATLSEQKWLVGEGVILERCIVDVVQNLVSWKTIFDEIRETDISNNLISTDLGQLNNIKPVEGLKKGYEEMGKYGFSSREINTLISRNSKMLLNV